jgi:two-component system, NtrC family, sensor kinase
MDKEHRSGNFSYVVGAEKGLRDLLAGAETMPLLEGAVEAGVLSAAITDSKGGVVWSAGCPGEKTYAETAPISVEGELVGRIMVTVGTEAEVGSYLKGLLHILSVATNMIIRANLKRVLTTETHATVVNRSYEELVETNRRLTVSEGKYRELAATLEKKVEERTGELKRAQEGMLRREKMASIGQLAAGLAHEINNPMGYVSSNIRTLKKYVWRMGTIMDFYRSLIEGPAVHDAIRRQAREKWKELKLDVVSGDMNDLIDQCLDGSDRVRKIVSDLQAFAHVEDGTEVPVNINREIDRTLDVISHQVPEGTEVVREYSPLPAFTCNPALICQVFLNIILNSLQSGSEKPRILLTTSCEDDLIAVSISDNGNGIPADIRNRIFDPFFTTKEVGKGTGMGLSVVYEIVTAYGGTIEVKSEPGEGATFLLKLPAGRRPNVKVF